ncbi:MAG: Cu(I)/Ag(I) efflux system membrane protein CusA/SilA [Crocinitomicaceae bacterium]|jgi:Cu(I)/Ag(I) efflux system membrane protein CusA/SilA
MISRIILWSIQNRILVILAMSIIIGIGLYSVKNTPIDAIPDLSDVQVIIKTSYPGQSPQVVEDQVTFPLTSAMLAVPKAKTVRGFSFFGDSYVYVIFEEGTDLYWARSRVLEYLNQASSSLPIGAITQLGPDATGVGWIYLYALSDKTGQHNLDDLRSIQDWFLKFELQTVAGVSEVAAIGGMIKQYQITVDPNKLMALNIPLSHIRTAVTQSNQEVGASVIEMAEAEYMVSTTGYLSNEQDIENISLGINKNGSPILLKDIAEITTGPQMRRGIAELNGEGEVVGGIVIMRSGENAQATIKLVKQKIEELKRGLPAGVEITTTYDRSELIKSATDNLWDKLIEELIVVALVCIIFLFHVRSSLVAIISLPVGILTAFIVMYWQGLNANIMSLAGIAIAIGAMVDGAIVMIENMHKHIGEMAKLGNPINSSNRWDAVYESTKEVGPALFFSLLIITVSFIPVFTLEAQEGKMFSPLAFTKTYAMAASAALAITLVPVLIGYFVRGNIPSAEKNPINVFLIRVYQPMLAKVLAYPKTAIVFSAFVLISSLYPASKIGSEFMPTLDEGSLMYMPTTYTGISIGKAREILQQTDKLLKSVPEVKTVFGKIGRAETATDPAPLTMIETFIQFKPENEWREGVTKESLRQEFTKLVTLPGLSNAWVMPIKTRIDMLATGIKTPVGIKIAGPDLNVIESIGVQLENILINVNGTTSVYSERVSSGRYINIDIKRLMAAQYNISIEEIQNTISMAIGGLNISQTTEGFERFPINIRYPQSFRNSPEKLLLLPIISKSGKTLSLGDVADIKIVNGPTGIKSENARLNGWTLVDIESDDIGSYVKEAKQAVNNKINLPAGYSLNWSGQYEYMIRAEKKLSYIIPLTLAIIMVLLFLNFKSLMHVFILMSSLPLSIVGSLWLMYLLEFNFSVAVAVGIIALAGVAIETGIIMMVYLDQAWEKLNKEADKIEYKKLINAIELGASRRVRPVLMTASATIIGLLPILYATGTGSEVMRRLAAPMVGGMVSSVILTLFILPAVYLLWRKASIEK